MRAIVLGKRKPAIKQKLPAEVMSHIYKWYFESEIAALEKKLNMDLSRWKNI